VTVRRKLTLIILLVAMAPLVLSAYSSLRIHQQAYDGKLTELRASAALRGATVTNALVNSIQSSLQGLVAGIGWPALSEEERLGAQWLVYQQADDLAVVAVLDANGQGVGTSVYRADKSDPGIAKHPELIKEDLQSFSSSIPFAEAQRDGFAIGSPVRAAQGGAPFVPIAFSTQGAETGAPWVVAIYLSLRGPCEALAQEKPSGTTMALIDAGGTVLCSEESEAIGALAPKELLAGLGEDPTWVYQEPGGEEIFVARASTGAGWQVLVSEPKSQVVAPSRRIGYQMLFWAVVGLIGALAAGMILARGINKPIDVLAEGAQALESGNLEHRIPLEGKDEFGRLSKSFNAMADEIADWNRTLRDKVDERTRDLKETQDLLVESKKQAALATMGAGIAHEINNPLTGVLSMVQIVRKKVEKAGGQEKAIKMLGKAEMEARRIRDIVQRMHAFSQQSEGIREEVPLHRLLGRSLDSLRDELVAADISVVNEVTEDSPAVFGSQAELQQAVSEIIKNATRAMNGMPERQLTISTETSGKNLVSLDIADTGRGIADEDLGKIFEPFFTAKDDWNSKGLGLSVVQRIITEHQGTIRVRSDEGNGATVHIVMPKATRRAHLE
jgi:signal transduction histidine kinase